METKSVMIVGVGGQGSLLASRILGNVLLSQGYAVKVSEVHGMSQRGGSVVTYVKYGDAVYSPTVEKGEADVIISFELLEAARWAGFLKASTYPTARSLCPRKLFVSSRRRSNPLRRKAIRRKNL